MRKFAGRVVPVGALLVAGWVASACSSGEAVAVADAMVAADLAVDAAITDTRSSAADGGTDGSAVGDGLVDAVAPDLKQDSWPVSAPQGLGIRAHLSGSQHQPVIKTKARGVAVLKVNKAATAIDFSISIENITGITGVDIHAGNVGSVAGVIFKVTDKPFTGSFKRTLTATDFVRQSGWGATSFATALALIVRGDTYVNVRTSANLKGEIRGQLGSSMMRTWLTAQRVVPPTKSKGYGYATTVLNAPQTEIGVALNVYGTTLATIKSAALHVGAPGQNGPVIFVLSAKRFTYALVKTVKAAALIPAPKSGIVSMADAVDALLAGNVYLQVKTSVYPGGDSRGQIGRLRFVAHLSGADVVPPVWTTPATGTVEIIMDALHGRMWTTITTRNLARAEAAEIHYGAKGKAGLQIYRIMRTPFNLPLVSRYYSAYSIVRQNSVTIRYQSEGHRAMLRDLTHFTLLTKGHPKGEVRGQLRLTPF